MPNPILEKIVNAACQDTFAAGASLCKGNPVGLLASFGVIGGRLLVEQGSKPGFIKVTPIPNLLPRKSGIMCCGGYLLFPEPDRHIDYAPSYELQDIEGLVRLFTFSFADSTPNMMFAHVNIPRSVGERPDFQNLSVKLGDLSAEFMEDFEEDEFYSASFKFSPPQGQSFVCNLYDQLTFSVDGFDESLLAVDNWNDNFGTSLPGTTSCILPEGNKPNGICQGIIAVTFKKL